MDLVVDFPYVVESVGETLLVQRIVNMVRKLPNIQQYFLRCRNRTLYARRSREHEWRTIDDCDDMLFEAIAPMDKDLLQLFKNVAMRPSAW